jgi:putative tryptophan/tyrosine transport system substrate-binding protein
MLDHTRRNVLTLLGGAAGSCVAGWPGTARAQQAERVRRIGVLMTLAASDPDAQLRMVAFEKGLRDLGWVEGRNLRIERRWVAGGADELRPYAQELLRLAPEVILSSSTPATLVLKELGGSVPVVFVQVTDPVGSGLVTSLGRQKGVSRPSSTGQKGDDGNLTGFTLFEFSIGTKWLETLKIVAPQVSRVALLFSPRTAPFADLFCAPIEAAAAGFDAATTRLTAVHGGEIERKVEEFARAPNGGLIVLPDVTTTNHRDLIIALAQRHRLPAIYPFRFFAVSGGLMSYGTDIGDVLRRAAGYVDRILKGAKAGELPVQTPSKLESVMNLKTAKALGITMPPLLLARADEVIE